MAIYLILIAACFTSALNLFMRKSVDVPGSTNLYVPIQLSFSCIASILLNPVRLGEYTLNFQTIGVGLGLGVFLGTMMFALGQCFKYGPANLTVAFLNSSSVLPAVVMAFSFGALFGHPYQWWNVVGSVIVVIAMFLSAGSFKGMKTPVIWSSFAALMVAAFVVFSAGLQWRVLLETSTQSHFLLPFKLDPSGSAWLMPSIFFSATLVQFVLIPFTSGEKTVCLPLVKWAFLGGLAHGGSMFFMILAAEKAWGWQNAVLFPTCSIAIIILCSVWGRFIYEEKILWTTNCLASIGLIIGAVHWPSLCS